MVGVKLPRDLKGRNGLPDELEPSTSSSTTTTLLYLPAAFEEQKGCQLTRNVR